MSWSTLSWTPNATLMRRTDRATENAAEVPIPTWADSGTIRIGRVRIRRVTIAFSTPWLPGLLQDSGAEGGKLYLCQRGRRTPRPNTGQLAPKVAPSPLAGEGWGGG